MHNITAWVQEEERKGFSEISSDTGSKHTQHIVLRRTIHSAFGSGTCPSPITDLLDSREVQNHVGGSGSARHQTSSVWRAPKENIDLKIGAPGKAGRGGDRNTHHRRVSGFPAQRFRPPPKKKNNGDNTHYIASDFFGRCWKPPRGRLSVMSLTAGMHQAGGKWVVVSLNGCCSVGEFH